MDMERKFEEWAGNKPVEFPDMDKDPVSFWCWKAWQKATELAHQAGGATRWRDVVDELPQEAQEVLFVRGGKTVHGAWIGGIFWHNNQKMAAAQWMPLPEPPAVSKLATAVKMAKPVAWIRFCSDGCYEGPIMDEQIEDVRKNSGAWTPLYARHNASGKGPEAAG